MKPIIKMSGVLLSLLLLTTGSLQLQAQVDTVTDNYQQTFDEFAQAIRQDFNTFKSKNDSLFYRFLNESWKEYRLFKNEPISRPEPVEQPVIDTAALKRGEIEIVPASPHKTLLEDSGRQIRYGTPEKYDRIEYAEDTYTLNFFGNNMKIPATLPATSLPSGNINQKEISTFFINYASNSKFNKVVSLLQKQATSHRFNGWSFLLMVRQAAKHYYKNINEQVLFTWLALQKAGYDVKVGYNKNTIYLLVNFDVTVYYYSFLNNMDKKYYLINFAEQPAAQQSIVTFPEVYPGEVRPLSLRIFENPDFPQKAEAKYIIYRQQKIELRTNNHLTAFYKTYPSCDLSVYFPPPPSPVALNSLDNYLKPVLNHRTKNEQVALLLDFVQRGFPYKSDEEQYGKETYFFAEETLAAPFSDCEDRAILLGQLIKHYTGLDAIGLAFPGHISLAVNLPEPVNGTYIRYQNKRFYICDPTYIGAKIGMLMPGFEKFNPQIFTFR